MKLSFLEVLSTSGHSKIPRLFKFTLCRSILVGLCIIVVLSVGLHSHADSISPVRSNHDSVFAFGSSPLDVLPPTLGAYSDAAVALAGDGTNTPGAAPTNATSATATTTADFKGKLEADSITGVVRITNAHPAGLYAVTVTAFDDSGSTQQKTFTLTVTTPAGCSTLPAAFDPAANLVAGTNPLSVAVGDFNGDGRQDIVVVNENSQSVSVFLRNAGNTGFDPKTDITVGSPANQPFSAAVGDFNGDGRQDIAVANNIDSTVAVLLRNASNTGFDAPLSFSVGAQPTVVAVGDFNGDGRLDIVTANNIDSSVSVLQRTSDNSSFDRTDYPLPGGSNPFGVAVADFNGDGEQDIVTSNVGTSKVSVLLRNAGNTGFDTSVEYDAAPGGSAFEVAAGDFNGDGKQDIGFTNPLLGSVSVLLRNAGNTGFDSHLEYSVGTSPRGIAVGDFNNDGKQDLVTSNRSSGNVSILLRNAGNTGFDSSVEFATGAGCFTVAVGDFNGDNRQDLVTANQLADVSLLSRICPTPTAADGTISGRILDANGTPIDGVALDLNGADSSETITDSNGDYIFADAKATGFYTVTPSRVNYTFSPSNRSFSLLGAHTEASFTAAANGQHLNPLGTPAYFVRQQYLDFLNREPDASGFQFWTNNITACGSDQNCAQMTRTNVSAAFFLSIEFQQTGYLTYRVYKAAYGNLPGTPVPVRLNEFLQDTQKVRGGVVVNQGNWQQQLEDNKEAFTEEFVQRDRFTAAFPASMTQAEFVDTLNRNAGGPLSPAELDQLINDLVSGAKTRGEVLRTIVEDPDFVRAEFNRAFVLMQYFGYLRRNPNDAPEATLDFQGYNFWLNKLDRFNGNFMDAEMVQAFLDSSEYRQRFGE